MTSRLSCLDVVRVIILPFWREIGNTHALCLTNLCMFVCVLVPALLCVTPKVISHEVTEVCLLLASEDGAGPSVVHQDMIEI